MSGEKNISVAIASYNGEKFIGEQIESICAQKEYVLEIVLSDDCSTDATIEVAHAVAEKHGVSLRIIRQARNVGVIENFISAFEYCRGEYIAYCDQDDVWATGRLRLFKDKIASGAVALYLNASAIVDHDLRPIGDEILGNPRSMHLKAPTYVHGFFGLGHQMIFRRRLLPAITYLARSKHGRLSDCFDWMIPFVAGLAGDVYVDANATVMFRRHQGSTSNAGGIASRGNHRGVRARAEKKRTEVELSVRELEDVLSDSDLLGLLLQESIGGRESPEIYLERILRLFRWRKEIYESGVCGLIGCLKILASGGYRSRVETGGLGLMALSHDMAASLIVSR